MALALEKVLTPREASFATDIDYDLVTKAFEKRQVINIAERSRTRTLDLRGTFKMAVAERLKSYPPLVKECIQNEISEELDKARTLAEVRDVNYSDRFVVCTFKTSEIGKLIEERLKMIERMRDLIVMDENVQAGAPTFRGTRIMVRHIAGLVRNRVDRQEIAEDFPEVTDEMIELAVLFDRLYPQRGRPATKGRSR